MKKLIFSAFLCLFLSLNFAVAQENCWELCKEIPSVVLAQSNLDTAQENFDQNPTEFNEYLVDFYTLSLFFYELSCTNRCLGRELDEGGCQGYFDRLYAQLVKKWEHTPYYDSMNASLMNFLNGWFGCNLPWIG